MSRNLLIAVMLGLAVPAVAATAAAPIAEHENEQEAQLITYAIVMIVKGDPEGAITRYLDPVIKRNSARYAADPRRVYGSRTAAEALLYIALATSEKRDAVIIGPTYGDALFTKAFALVDLARAAEARPLFEAAIALSPSNPRYLSELGNAYQTEKDWAKALTIFENAATAATLASPEPLRAQELARALRGQGYALTELVRLNESEAVYQRCLKLDPDDKMARAELTFIAGLRAKSTPR